MACDKMGILISRVVDGEGSEEDQRRVSEHVQGCAACREELELFQANEGLVEEALSGRAFQDEIVRGVLPHVESEAGAGRRGRSVAWSEAARALLRIPWSPSAAAAAVLLPFAAFFMYQTLELQRTLLSVSAARQQTPAVDPATASEYRELARHYQSLTDRLLETLGRRLDVPAIAKSAAEPTHADTPAEQTPVQETIVVETPKEKATAEGSVQVLASVVDDGIQVVWDVAQDVKPTGFKLYRRAAAEPEFAEPIMFKPGDPYFLDRNLKPKTKYVYKVEAITPAGAPPVSSPEVVLETPGDLKIQFLGTAVAAGSQPEQAMLRVSKWVDDGWQHMMFLVRQGEGIGKKTFVADVAKEVDFETGWTLGRVVLESRPQYSQEKREIQLDPDGRPLIDPVTGKLVTKTKEQTWVAQEPWIELVDIASKKKGLWKRESAVGTFGSLGD